MKIACIGGAGFVGHHLALRLKSHGHDVLIYDSLLVNNRYSPEVRGNPEYVAMTSERMSLLRAAGIAFVGLDARDYHNLSAVLGDYKPDSIVHLAAVAHIDRANKTPHSTFDHMMVTLENALDVARSIGCGHFVFFSSSTAYGDFQRPTVDETEPCVPKGIYGSLKFSGEMLTKAYGDLGLPYTIIRPCALYGPRCVSGRVTQKFVELAHNNQPIVIDGDGEGRHDFTSIHDLVDGIERVLTNETAKGEVFNLTAGQSRSLNELVAIIRDWYPTMQVTTGPLDPQKPSRGTMSCAKAHRLLGYVPQWQLDKGMDDYIGWYQGFRKYLERKAA